MAELHKLLSNMTMTGSKLYVTIILQEFFQLRKKKKTTVFLYYYYYYYYLPPLCRAFRIIYVKQTMYLGYIVLQLFCTYNLRTCSIISHVYCYCYYYTFSGEAYYFPGTCSHIATFLAYSCNSFQSCLNL
jgi:hypothetical protein